MRLTSCASWAHTFIRESFEVICGNARFATRSWNRPTGCRLQMYPLKYPVICFIARCAILQSRRVFVRSSSKQFRVHASEWVCASTGIRKFGAICVFERMTLLKIGFVPLNQTQHRFASTSPNALQRPFTDKPYFRAIPGQITFLLSFNCRVLGKSCLHTSSQQPCFLRCPFFRSKVFFLQ